MDTPQEVEVWLILPAIRKHLAIALRQRGMKQKDVAKELNITEAAVSQYINKKRGDEIHFTKDVVLEIKASAKKIFKKQSSIRPELQKLLKDIKTNKAMCDVCHAHTASEKGCDICFR